MLDVEDRPGGWDRDVIDAQEPVDLVLRCLCGQLQPEPVDRFEDGSATLLGAGPLTARHGVVPGPAPHRRGTPARRSNPRPTRPPTNNRALRPRPRQPRQTRRALPHRLRRGRMRTAPSTRPSAAFRVLAHSPPPGRSPRARRHENHPGSRLRAPEAAQGDARTSSSVSRPPSAPASGDCRDRGMGWAPPDQRCHTSAWRLSRAPGAQPGCRACP